MHDLSGCGRAALSREGASGDEQKGDDASTRHNGLAHGSGSHVNLRASRSPRHPSHLNATTSSASSVFGKMRW